jgi:hypothetical protein
MGSFGESVKTQINNLIDNPIFRSSITITPITKNKGDYGGYSAVSDTEGIAVTTYGVPVNYLKNISGFELGKARTGTVKIAVKASESIDEDNFDYKISWQGSDWDLISVDRPFLNDVIVVQILELKKELA